jgi:uncharacterized protein YprB with RNaseH-like and TPR domain
MNLGDRLRSIVHGGSGDPGDGAPRPAPQRSADPADLLDGEWREANGQRFLVIEHHYAPGHRHGRSAVVDSAPGQDGYWPALALIEPELSNRRLLFIDLETTGLAGGAGTYAFLVGCGWFDRGGFTVRQLLLTGFASERALLQELAGIAADAGGLASYNGKTFDLPVIETRFVMNRMRASLSGMPHLDMLHPARRLWRSSGGAPEPADVPGAPGPREEGGCRLTTLERTLLGHVRDGDVPGFEIPARYFQYVRTGDARSLVPVLEHNRLDILSLALLTARLATLLEEGAPAAHSGPEALGLGRIFERACRTEAAAACFTTAAALAEDVETAAEALRASAVIYRRARRYREAAALWRRVLDLTPCPPRLAQEAVEALAVHHEHRVRELETARRFALRSLGLTTNQTRIQAARHRLARLDRKLGASVSSPSALPLF